jgi:tetratricopeptide (TPR) repeat protein
VPRALASLLLLLTALCVAPEVGRAQAQRGSRPSAKPAPAASVPPTSIGAAQAALDAGRYAQAEAGFGALAARGDALRPRALLGLGRVLLITGRYEDAERKGAEAAKLPGWAGRGHTLRGEALSAVGKRAEAQAAFEAALADPKSLRARVLLARLLLDRGRKAQAEPHLLALIEAYNDDTLGTDAEALAYVAMAARALGSMHDANDAFREAALADRGRVETQLEWAALFLEKYDQRHAVESAAEALEHNPNDPRTHVLLARLSLMRGFDFETATEHVDRALAVNPRLAAPHVLRAGMALRDMDVQRADQHLDVALGIDPADLEALSVRAAGRFLADDAAGFARVKKQVLALNPRFARFFSIVSEYAEWEHRYAELVELSREALAIDPDDALAHATLGLNLLREGREPEGVAALREAWKRDRFNVLVFNTLNLYEKVLEPEYEFVKAPPLLLRMHKEERPALEPYVPTLLQGAYEGMRKRYQFTPEGPVRIELYAAREHFSVRTTGLPNVGVQGVCFGKVVTALSPRGGPFNWGQITWHELAHVFHLQLSKNHVPRWFTEGLAELETTQARPEWKREDDFSLWISFMQDRVPKLRDLNRAFTQARSPEDLMTAYYLASQVVAYVVERFGWDKVRPMLVAWGQGKRTEQVIEEVLGLSIEQLDADARAALRKRLTRYDDDFWVDFSKYEDLPALEAKARAAPKDADAQAALALGLAAADRFDDAGRAGELALSLKKDHPLAHFALARVALQAGDSARAARGLQAIIDGGKDAYVLRMMLARAALDAGDVDRARIHAERAATLDPTQTDAFQILIKVAGEKSDPVLGRKALTALAELDQHDRIVHLALMAALLEAKDYAAVVKYGERALLLDPENAEVHRLLAEGLARTSDPTRALFELDRATALGHGRPARLELIRARALLALGKRAESRAAARKAVTLDPKLEPQAADLLSP